MQRNAHSILALVALSAALAAQGRPIGFAETYALAADRQAALANLIPGTDEHYHLTCRERLDARDFASVRRLLTPWIRAHGRNERVLQIENRLALLDFGDNPAAAFALLQERLGLQFAHQRQALRDAPRQDLPSRLDPQTLDVAQLRRAALAAHPGSVQGFTDAALPNLLASDLDADQLRHLLGRLDRADLDNLPQFVVRDLAHTGSGGFGSLRVHALLSLDQLEACAQLTPTLLGEPRFVAAMLTKLAADAPDGWQHDPAARDAHLQRLHAFARRLPPAFASLTLHVLHHRLQHGLASGRVDRDLFLEYLRIPRRASFLREDFVRRHEKGLATANSEFPSGLPTVVDEERLVRACLEQLFASEDAIAPYDEFLHAVFVRNVLAETKLLLGQGDAQRWYTLHSSPGELARLERLVELEFPPTNRRRFGATDEVAITIDCKNVPTLLVKVFEIDHHRYLVEQQRDVDANIGLDGVVPNHELTVTSELPAMRRERRTFRLPQLTEPGLYVVEFVGGGISSRAVIQKGSLDATVRTTAAGQSFRVYDETGSHRPDATLSFGGRDYTAGENGEILLPFTTNPGRRQVVLRAGRRAALQPFEHTAENYQLTAQIHLLGEALVAGQRAAIVVRPDLRCAGAAAALQLLEEPVLQIVVTDLDGLSTTKEVPLLALRYSREFREDLLVPERLQSVRVSLRGTCKDLQGQPVRLQTAEQVFAANGIDQTATTRSVLIGRSPTGWFAEVRGKNGEVRAGIACDVILQHRDFAAPIHAALATDGNGRIELGPLAEVRTLVVQSKDHGAARRLDTTTASVPTFVHALAGEPVRMVYPGSATSLDRRHVSLTSDARDHFHRLRLGDGMLEIVDLPRGSYLLTLHETGHVIPVQIAAGTRDNRWLVGERHLLAADSPEPLRFAAVEADATGLRIQLAGHGKDTRVHVQVSRYAPERSLLDALRGAMNRAQRGWSRSTAAALFAAGRTLSDEYRYVLDRRLAQKYPGNMLPRPSLLTNPWRLDDRSRNEAVGLGQGKGSDFVGLVQQDGKPGAPGAFFADGDAGDVRGTVTPSLDFLPHGAVVLTNLTPDANGEIRVPRAALRGGHVQVVALDGDAAVQRDVVLAAEPMQPRARQLPKALDATQPLAQRQHIEFVAAGGNAVLGDPRSVQTSELDSLAAVFRTFVTIRNDAELAKFVFVTTWPSLPKDQQLRLYGEHACHELHFFLYHKDRAFFDAVVAPSLRSKRDRTFLDRWLLGEDLRSFTEPWDFAQLHLVEKILLAQRLDGAARTAVARLVKEQLELRPLAVELQDRLLTLTLASEKLADISSILKGEEWGNLPEAGKESAFDSNQWNSAVGLGGGAGGGIADRRARLAERERLAKKDEAGAAPKTGSDDFYLGRTRRAGAEELEAEVAERKQVRQLYRAVEPTRLVVERNYWQRRNAESLADVVAPNRFWADFAAAEPGRPFASAAVLEANGSFLETMFALAVLDLPFVAGKHEVTGDGEQRTLRAATPLLLVKKEVAPAERAAGEAPLLLGENFFRADDRHQFVDGEQRDKFVAGEFLTDVTYGCQVVVTNPSSQKRTANVLLQIPAGAIPVQKGFWTRGTTVELQPYATAQLEYFFYFPATGEFAHYPAHAAEKGRIAANATARALRVVDVPTTVDTTSWEVVSQQGSLPDVLAFLDRSNLQRLDLDKIAWRMQDQGTFLAVLDLLRKRRIYHDTLWSYGIRHGDVPSTREYLEHQHAFLAQCGAHLRSPLVDIDPVVRRLYEHLELDPLVHQRAHLLGSKRVIGNADLAAQYGKLLDLLSYKPQLGSEDWLAVTYYMLLQDRVEEALQHFAKVRRDEVQEQVQYDYLAAYLSFFTAEPQQARGIAERYRDYPVAHWQKRFATVLVQLDEIDGKAVATDQPGNDTLAATAPALELRVDGKSLRLDHKNLAGCELRFYPIDVEFAFSSRPFADTDRGGAAYVQPVLVQQATFAKDAVTTTLELPPRFHQQNVRIEVAAAGIRRAQSYFANALAVRFLDAYGQVVVTEPDTNQPLPKTYVKVFARLANGEVRFHKDGYTDLRGRFDYASLSDDPNAGATRYAVLVLHEQRGAVIRELEPPTR